MPLERKVTKVDRRPAPALWQGYFVAIISVAGLTALALAARDYFLPPNLIMLYLLAVTLVARRYRRGPAILASLLSVAAFDFFFVHPHLTFAVEDVQYLVTLGIMLLVGVLIGGLTGQLEEQVEARVASQSQVANEQLRNSLLSSISHDLRSPLAGISGAAGTLLTLPPADMVDAAPTLLETIRDESDRLTLLVTNILDMTHLESGQVELHLEWLPLEEAIGAAVSAMETRLSDRKLHVTLPPQQPLVKADAVLLERLFANLLDNALKYTPKDSSVDISAKSGNNAVTVTVADRGPGLPPGDPMELFRKFGRSGRPETTSLPDSRGSGLGLSICKAIVEAHGGVIKAENRPGGGAVFTFTLPQAEQAPHVPVEQSPIERGGA